MSVLGLRYQGIDSVIDQFIEHGMPDIAPGDLQIDTRGWVRYGPKKKAYYRIERRVSRAGNEYFVGAFGFKSNGPFSIRFDGRKMSAQEAADLRAEQKRVAEIERKRRNREVALAAERALDTWRKASPSGAAVYCARKKIISPERWVRYWNGCVVVPMCRYDLPKDEMLRAIQIIRPNGIKRFTKGMAKSGCACALGLHEVGKPILICEGFATAVSVWMAVKFRYRVVIAFDADNLLPVARLLRASYPKERFLICADDDYLTPGNPGRTKANIAALDVGRTGVLYPIFYKGRDGEKLSDFNDLHVREGLDEVHDQVSMAMRYLHKV